MYQGAVNTSHRSIISIPVSDADCADKCVQCAVCQKECAFLQKYGTPGQIARLCDAEPDKWLPVAFECSLCGLCASVCPKQLDPSTMFLNYRRKMVKAGQLDFSKYRTLLNYEQRGTSEKYSLYHLPENCTTVFFPGCSLVGTRPQTTLKTFEYLKKQDKTTGIVLDCCTKPSHDLGRQDHFEKMFSQMAFFFWEKGIKTIIVACPNCHKIFDTYGKFFKVQTIYDVIARCGFDVPQPLNNKITIHDPCPVRKQNNIQESVRTLARACGLEILSTPHEKEKTYCCGEGGTVGCVAPEFARAWSEKRTDENSGHPIGTYCAGCVNMLSGKSPVFHILDLVFDPHRTIVGKACVARAPFTYLNRLKLKRKIRKLPSAVIWERNFGPRSLSGFSIKRFFKKLVRVLQP